MKFLNAILHTGAGAVAAILAAGASGWHPANPVVAYAWTAFGVTFVAAISHALQSYADKK